MPPRIKRAQVPKRADGTFRSRQLNAVVNNRTAALNGTSFHKVTLYTMW